MSFDPNNCLLKIWESIRTPTLKMGVHLGVWGFIPSHSLTLLGAWNVTPELHSWPAPLQALALIVNPRLGLWHKQCKWLVKMESILGHRFVLDSLHAHNLNMGEKPPFSL
jgi:hypothetical protein